MVMMTTTKTTAAAEAMNHSTMMIMMMTRVITMTMALHSWNKHLKRDLNEAYLSRASAKNGMRTAEAAQGWLVLTQMFSISQKFSVVCLSCHRGTGGSATYCSAGCCLQLSHTSRLLSLKLPTVMSRSS